MKYKEPTSVNVQDKKYMEYLNTQSGIKIVNLPHYPYNDMHLQVEWDIPVLIVRNTDDACIMLEPLTDKWLVLDETELHRPMRFFDDLESAIKEGLLLYDSYLKSKNRLLSTLFLSACLTETDISSDPYSNTFILVRRLLAEYNKYGKIIIAYDFDYTLNNFRSEGYSYDIVESLLRELRDFGYFICYTASKKERHPEIRETISNKNIPLDAINENAPFVDMPKDAKLYYNMFLDDRAGLGQSLEVLKLFLDAVKLDA